VPTPSAHRSISFVVSVGVLVLSWAVACGNDELLAPADASASTGGQASSGGSGASGGSSSGGSTALGGGAGVLGAGGFAGALVDASSDAEPSDALAEDGSGDGTVVAATVVPDFKLVDENPASSSYQKLVSPRDYLGQVSAWYFGHST